MLGEACVCRDLLKIVALGTERVGSIHREVRAGEQIVHQSAGNGRDTELVAALQNVAELRSVRPVGTAAAELAIVVAVVAIGAQDARADGTRGIRTVEV